MFANGHLSRGNGTTRQTAANNTDTDIACDLLLLKKISHCERHKWYCLWHKHNPDKVSGHNIIHCSMSYNHLSVLGNRKG